MSFYIRNENLLRGCTSLEYYGKLNRGKMELDRKNLKLHSRIFHFPTRYEASLIFHRHCCTGSWRAQCQTFYSLFIAMTYDTLTVPTYVQSKYKRLMHSGSSFSLKPMSSRRIRSRLPLVFFFRSVSFYLFFFNFIFAGSPVTNWTLVVFLAVCLHAKRSWHVSALIFAYKIHGISTPHSLWKLSPIGTPPGLKYLSRRQLYLYRLAWLIYDHLQRLSRVELFF